VSGGADDSPRKRGSIVDFRIRENRRRAGNGSLTLVEPFSVAENRPALALDATRRSQSSPRICEWRSALGEQRHSHQRPPWAPPS
jgi:hypothetical protein